MHEEALGNAAADRRAWIEGGVGVLKDDLELPSQSPQRLALEGRQILAVDIAWLSPRFAGPIRRLNGSARHAREAAFASFWANMQKLSACFTTHVPGGTAA